jgi:AcrR family transcriptional regulator
MKATSGRSPALAAPPGAPRKARAAPGEQPKADGRVNRSIVTRKKIVDALVALVNEGHLSPTAEVVAARADVGLRTVFRHFDDMDSLYREISIDLDALVQPLLRVRLNAPTWQARLLLSVDHRSDIFERMAPMFVAAQVHRHESAFLAQNMVDSAALQRNLLMRLLPAAAAEQSALVAALDLALSADTWIRLRREQELGVEEARGIVRLVVAALLAQAGLGS